MANKKIIVPSILAANFAHLESDIKEVEFAGAEILHIDIMDGHFVPNISFGPSLVKCIDRFCSLPLDTHLMVEYPDQYIEPFRQAGSDIITIHLEAKSDLLETIKKIRNLGMKAGISIKPETPVSSLKGILLYVDLVLIMTVNPGFGGQKFLMPSIAKIQELKSLIDANNLGTIIEVDGGIDLTNVNKVTQAGAEYLVAGSAVFSDGRITENFNFLRQAI